MKIFRTSEVLHRKVRLDHLLSKEAAKSRREEVGAVLLLVCQVRA